MPQPPIKLLLIDDDVEFANLVGAKLTGSKQRSIQVDHIADFDTAREIITAAQHDVYLIDHQLGEEHKTGLDLISYARHVVASPMIMLTSNTHDDTGDIAISLGASDFLHKHHATIPVIEQVIRNSIQRNHRMKKIVRERDQLERELQTDQLTGVSSRIAIERYLDQAISACKTGQMGVIMYLDLDKFKQVNDYYGHAAGDLALKTVARRVVETIRTTDYLGRMGGDEFLLVGQPDRQDIFTDGTVDALIRKLRIAVSRPMHVYDVAGESVEIRTAASIGVIKYENNDKGKDYLIALADKAMYMDKARQLAEAIQHDRLGNAQHS